MKTLKLLTAVRTVVIAAVQHARGEITDAQLRQAVNEGRAMIGRKPLPEDDN